jgi:hypothetical protein
MKARIAIALAAVGAVTLAAAPSLGASECSKKRCVPRTGTWSIPASPNMQRKFDGHFYVVYRPNGKPTPSKYGVKSRYGNTLTDFWVWLPYRCSSVDYPWDEQALEFSGPLKIDANGRAKVTIAAPPSSPDYRMESHTVSFQFKRTGFTGRVSGTLYRYNSDDSCSTSGKFSGTWKYADFHAPIVQR